LKDTVFKWLWKWISRKRGRPKIDWELIKLIRKMANENPPWKAGRIVKELSILGYEVDEKTVRKYMPKTSPLKNEWKSFLHNTLNQTSAFDFFVVRTITFKAIYVFVVLSHDKRQIKYWNVTEGPDSSWVSRQLLQAFPGNEEPPKYLLQDNDPMFQGDVPHTIKNLIKSKSKKTSPHSDNVRLSSHF
jgi:hypothetical protein